MENIRTLTAAALLLTGAVAWANSSQESSTSVLRGSVSVAQAGGGWKSASAPVSGQWMKADKPNTAVEIPGALIRFSPGSEVRFTTSKEGDLKMSARGGKVYVALQNQANCELKMGDETVTASRGEFAVDASSDKLYVVSGNAQKVSGTQELSVLATWDDDGLLALDGPDVRKRARQPKTYTEGEQSKGRQLGEDDPPPPRTPTPTPSISQSPAMSPSPQPPSPSPSPTQTQPTITESGGFPWEVVGVLGGLGIGAGLLAGGSPPSTNVVTPISP